MICGRFVERRLYYGGAAAAARKAVYELALQTPLFRWAGIINNVVYRPRNDKQFRGQGARL